MAKKLRSRVPADALVPFEETAATKYGTLFHTLMLEPHLFGNGISHYVRPDIYPATKTNKRVKAGLIAEGDPVPWNGNATFCADWLDEHDDKMILRATGPLSAEGLVKMREKVMELPETRDVFMLPSEREVAYFAVDPVTGIQLKARIDIRVEHDAGHFVFIDPKSTDDAGDFERTAGKLGYHLQADFYSMLARLNGQTAYFAFMPVSTSAPYTARIGWLDEESLKTAAIENRKLINLYAKCEAANDWPAYKVTDTGERAGLETFTLPKWIHFQPVAA